MNYRQLTILFILFINFFSYGQSLLYEVSIQEQIENAELIIEGEIIEKKSYRSSVDDKIYTINKVKVYKSFKGNSTDYINIITKGGSIDFELEVVRPSLQLNTNDLGVFILKPSINTFVNYNDIEETPFYYAEADMQGFYKYNLLFDKVTNPFTVYEGIETSFYNLLEEITGQNNQILPTLSAFNRQARSTATGEISFTSFSPAEVRSGTGDIITIEGEGFGTETGTLFFQNSDDGGFSTIEPLESEILSWTDTIIIVEVPSAAGTGRIQIVCDDGRTISSNSDLTVLSSELNVVFDDFEGQSLRAKVVNLDGNGGYTWTYNTDFFNQVDPPNSFENAVNEWVCETGISWLISDELSDETGSDFDGVNLVSFESALNGSSDLSIGVLALTTTFYSGCVSGNTITAFVSEIDMVFNSDFQWFYGEGTPQFFENDFQGTATHELGHAHGLGHVIAPTKLMHFETSSGAESATRDIDEDSSIGATINFDFSKSANACGEALPIDRACVDEEASGDIIPIDNNNDENSGEDNNNEIEFIIDEDLNIIVDSNEPLSFLGIFDLSGRLVATSETLSPNRVSVARLATTIYIIVMEEQGGSRTTRKIVVE